MTFGRFMGAVLCLLLIGGWVANAHPAYFVAIWICCGAVAFVGGTIAFFVRHR